MRMPLFDDLPPRLRLVGQDKVWEKPAIEERVGAVAQYLLGLGVRRGERVGIRMDASPEMLMAMLGAMKAGAAMLPIDPTLPAERQRDLLEDSQAVHALVSQIQPDWGIPQSTWAAISSPNRTAPLPELRPEDLAYLIYTSGTTGKPKGVQIAHGALANYLAFAQQTYCPAGEPVRTALISSVSIDLTLTSLCMPLLTGGTLYFSEEKPRLQMLLEAVQNPDINFLKCTPTHLTFINTVQHTNLSLKTLIVGGEAFHRSAAAQMQALFPNARIFNEYGPTEATVGCIVQEYDPSDSHSSGQVPIGQPIPGMEAHLLDEAQQPVAQGEKGELYLSGKGLAAGYFERPMLNQQRFVRLPTGQRAYRTGDLAYSDGQRLHYAGRTDDQLKISGYRVEPGEVTAALMRHPAVSQAFATGHNGQLIAFVAGDSLSHHTLHRFLAKLLPQWMLPKSYYLTFSWPSKPNGKLDQQALLAQSQLLKASEQPAPTALANGQLSRWIAQHFQLGELHKDQSLLLQGLDSMQLMELVAYLEAQYQRPINIGKLLENPSIQQLEQVIAQQPTPDHVYRYCQPQARATVFCFPPAIGGLMAYRQLLEQQPAFNMVMFDFIPREKKLIHVYQQMIEAETPAGKPIILMGYSGGGNMAFELAKALEATGRAVAAVLMIDAFRKKTRHQQLPASIVQMKTEALAALPENQRSHHQATLDRYYELINLELGDFQGQTQADLHLLTSQNRHQFGDRRQDGEPLFQPWDTATSGLFTLHQGKGDHAQMLSMPYLAFNLAIIHRIVNQYTS